jgi:hypothetical protein
VAGLLAVAVFGLILTGGFNRGLERRLDALHLPAAERQSVEIQRPKLAAIETDDPRVRAAVEQSFLEGYRTVLWIAAALGIASSLTALYLLAPRQQA